MEEKIKILKTMSEVTKAVDFNEFARSIGLTPKQAIEELEELVKVDLVKKVSGGYGITEKGRMALKAYEVVPERKEFHFYAGIGQPADLKAKSIREFCDHLRKMEPVSLEFHLYRGDFENWMRNVFGNTLLAEELQKMQTARLYGDSLREKLLRTIEAAYHIENP